MIREGKLRPSFQGKGVPKWLPSIALQCIALNPSGRPNALKLSAMLSKLTKDQNTVESTLQQAAAQLPRTTLKTLFEAAGAQLAGSEQVVDEIIRLPENSGRSPCEYAELFRQSSIYASMMGHIEGPLHPMLLESTEKHMAEMPAFQVDYYNSTKC
ncbi:hypothetical protein THRCLA_08354 [Thraustotheca clavata]|uniref:Uncharacterized protein n=1 Tax=Thraustotheca clavata TaxID=74557 RepID=A0A1V9Z6X3_9STRA|nr:hypothetical protein THRCLA_08354 [Thraustotheca clavata]